MSEKEVVDHGEHIEPAPTTHDKTQEGVEATVAEARKNVDTVHQDEAMKVLATYDGDLHWDPQEEKVLVRKIDKRLMPILILTYGLQYYDKAMLAQAVGLLFSGQTFEVSADDLRQSSVCERIWTCSRAIVMPFLPLSST